MSIKMKKLIMVLVDVIESLEFVAYERGVIKTIRFSVNALRRA
jgi:hypothetical protein